MSYSRDRLLAAACRYLAAERAGGNGGAAEEMQNAQAALDEAALDFARWAEHNGTEK